MYVLNFVLVLLIPVAMLVVEVKWWVSPLAYKTGKLAYRTQESERSEEARYFVHQHCAKLWGRFGLILGVIATILMILLKEGVGKYILWFMMAEAFVLCVTIVIFDFLVKNLFDENGSRIRQILRGPWEHFVFN